MPSALDLAVVARAAVIADLPGQDMIYLAKEADARTWIADPAPNPAAYPLLATEIGLTAPDAESLAQLWLNLAALWREAAAELEALRLSVGRHRRRRHGGGRGGRARAHQPDPRGGVMTAKHKLSPASYPSAAARRWR